VRPEGFAVQEHTTAQAVPLIELQVLYLVAQTLYVDPQLLNQSSRYRRIRPRTVNLQRAAIHQMQSATELKLIPPGMAAKIIVVVEDQYAGVRRGACPEEISRGQPAYTAAYYDQIVRFTRISRATDL